MIKVRLDVDRLRQGLCLQEMLMILLSRLGLSCRGSCVQIPPAAPFLHKICARDMSVQTNRQITREILTKQKLDKYGCAPRITIRAAKKSWLETTSELVQA